MDLDIYSASQAFKKVQSTKFIFSLICEQINRNFTTELVYVSLINPIAILFHLLLMQGGQNLQGV